MIYYDGTIDIALIDKIKKSLLLLKHEKDYTKRVLAVLLAFMNDEDEWGIWNQINEIWEDRP